MLRILAIVLLILNISPATAGAWMRDKGSGYSSTTLSTTLSQDFSESTYLEFGVRDDLTLGAEVAFYTFSTGIQSGTAMVFLRRPIGGRDRPNLWAYELGFAAGWPADIPGPYSWGGLRWGGGCQLSVLNGGMWDDAWLSNDT